MKRTRASRDNAACGAAVLALLPLLAATTLGCATGGAASAGETASAPASAADAGPADRSDYLVLAPRSYRAALAPLVAHREAGGHRVAVRALEDVYARRSAGRPSAEAVRDEIAALAAPADSPLRYVLLVGDPLRGSPPLPSFEPQLDYHADERPGTSRSFRSDEPFALPDRPGRRALAVGRIPATSADELAGVVGKIVGYERGTGADAWQRRVVLFGGPASFGAFLDGLIEQTAMELLDRKLPYDYDLDLVFAKPGSPYAYRFDALGDKLVHDLDAGSLLAVYVGHGARDSFDTVGYRGRAYPIGSARDLARVDIGDGKPLFVALTCHTGAYGQPDGRRSLAETLALNPGGPVAVFAASVESHPYPNYLYAQAFLARFLAEHAASVGEGVVDAKSDMVAGSLALASLLVDGDLDALKRDHTRMYNLFGDPATVLRYPRPAEVRVASGGQAPGAPVGVRVTTPGTGDAELEVTLETERRTLPVGLTSERELARLPAERAFEVMVENHARALDKVVARARVLLHGGLAEVVLLGPTAPGTYYVKALVRSGGGSAAGHARFEVAAR
ncbi:MAG: hypothetical protein IT373_36225 [Polyangiaceae bacterium]|nr:hypothetical protein [Polyangiaceae bacterium]